MTNELSSAATPAIPNLAVSTRNRLAALESSSPEAAGAALLAHLNEAEAKAWDSLGKYKFQMFGYWAAIWVHLNRIGGFKRPNPWKALVKSAREPIHV